MSDPEDTEKDAAATGNQSDITETPQELDGPEDRLIQQEVLDENVEQKKQGNPHENEEHKVQTIPNEHERQKEQGAPEENGLPMSLDNIGDDVSLSSEESSLSDNIRSKVPRINCPEKIIICLDLSPETNSISFQSRSAPERSIFQLVQKAFSIFIKTKSALNPDHEFGLMVVEDAASWYQHFTNNVETICMALNRLTPIEDEAGQELPVFDLECLLEKVRENVELPVLEDLTFPPPCVVRLVLVYGRSLCQPFVSDAAKQVLGSLLASPYFFFDVLYVHELPSENNLCEATYDLFCDLDEDEVGYMLEVSRSTTRLFDHMAALLAHPLQRPKQRDTFYKLNPEEETNL